MTFPKTPTLKRFALTLWAALLSLFISLSAAHAQTPPAIDAFFETENFGAPKLSPSGRYVAVPDYRGDTNTLMIMDLDQGSKISHVDLGDIDLGWVSWATDDRLLLGISLVQGVRSNAYYYRDENGDITQTFQVRFARVLAMSRDGSDQATMFSNASNRVKKTLSEARLINTLHHDADHILMSAEDRTLNLWKVNIHTGEATLEEKGTTNTYNWQLNNEGVPVVRLERIYNDLYVKISVRAPGEKDWSKILTVKLADVDSLRFLAATKDPEVYYVSTRPEGYDKASVFTYNLRKKAVIDQITSHESVDIYNALVNSQGEYIGSLFFEDRITYDFINKGLNQHINALNTFFGDTLNVSIEDVSAEGAKWLVSASGPRNPGAYYIYDLNAKRADFLLPGKVQIDEKALGKMDIITYSARDGLTLKGYLSQPARPSTSPAPLIVMPHGGPHARDYFVFDRMVQFLTTRGYQVFQPNFRGSEGFGEAFKSKGFGQWGGVMQDDVTDGVKHLIQTGQASPDKICIVGASYGGYAALIGAIDTPQLYQCSASIAGVTDLIDMLDHDKKLYGVQSEIYLAVKKTIGDPKTDKARLIDRSPITHSAKFNVPVLLIHGTRDPIVPARQSQALYSDMLKAGRSVDYLELSGADHSLSGRNMNDEDADDYDYAYKQALAKIETFLATHLK